MLKGYREFSFFKVLLTTLGTRRDLGRVSSGSYLWDRYRGQNKTAPQGTVSILVPRISHLPVEQEDKRPWERGWTARQDSPQIPFHC